MKQHSSRVSRVSIVSLAGAGALAMFAAIGCQSGAKLRTMTVDEVDARIAAHDGKTFVFDDNPHDRYVKGHLPGAKWVAGSEPTQADLPSDHGALLVFYCASEL